MRRFIGPIVLGLVVMFALMGCGADGEDGDAYGCLSWLYQPTYAYFEDPSVPSTVYNGVYYPLIVGRWDWEYISSGNPSILHYGYYTTYVDEGESGKLFSDGDDGVDLYFEMYLGAYGPDFILHEDASSERSLKENAALNQGFAAKREQEIALVEASGVKASTVKNSIAKAAAQKFSRRGDDTTWEIDKTITSGKYKVTLRANSIKLP